MGDGELVIRQELRAEDIHARGAGYSPARLKPIRRALRKLHTLETMAVNIYKYEMGAGQGPLHKPLIEAMANEMTHLQDFQIKLCEYGLSPRKTRFVFWLVGFFLGRGSRFLGRRRILKTNIWAEKKAILDYQHFLRDVEWDDETRPAIAKDAADEEAHLERWTQLLGERQ